jgi:hypothetical protein
MTSCGRGSGRVLRTLTIKQIIEDVNTRTRRGIESLLVPGKRQVTDSVTHQLCERLRVPDASGPFTTPLDLHAESLEAVAS